jgi:hypothetical protein
MEEGREHLVEAFYIQMYTDLCETLILPTLLAASKENFIQEFAYMWFCFSFVATKMRNIFKVDTYKIECVLIDRAVSVFHEKVFKELHA